MLGPRYLVAPVTKQGAVSRSVYFPAGARWLNYWNASQVIDGGVRITVAASLDTLPLFVRS
jgi:alpha-D-xyloside xylohydrolase